MARGQPRIDYSRTYVLMPPDADAALVKTVVDATWDRERWTVGGSADDSGIGDLDVRRIVAISPGNWDGDLAAFFAEHYPGIIYWPLDYSNDYQLKGRLLAYSLREAGFSLRYPTTHLPARVTQEFGVATSYGHHMGLDLASSWANNRDEVLSAVGGTVVTAGDVGGGFGQQVRIQTIIPDGRAAWVRHAHLVAGSIAVSLGDHVEAGDVLGKAGCTGSATGDHLHLDVWTDGEYADPALLMEWPEATRLRIGFNDPARQGAEQWMMAEGVGGVLCVPLFIGTDARSLDFSAAAAADIRVVVNLRYSWAHRDGGAGTLPPSGKDGAFIDACLGTMRNASGVWGWTIGNEHNVPDEWPAANDPITPARYAAVYNSIWDEAPETRLAPGAIDPYNAQYMDCREYWGAVWAGIHGADFVAVHGYVRGPNPDLCWSGERFSNDPLTWQGLNYWLCCQTLLDALPSKYAHLPAVVTEFNHLWKDGGEGDWGWVNDTRAGDVVRAVMKRARQWNAGGHGNRIEGVCLYRWKGDKWEAYNNAHVLAAVKDEA